MIEKKIDMRIRCIELAIECERERGSFMNVSDILYGANRFEEFILRDISLPDASKQLKHEEEEGL